MPSKWTKEEFVKKVDDILGEDYKVIGDYVNIRTKIKMKHNKCGYIYEQLPSSILKGSKCPKCLKYNIKSTDEVKREIYDLVGNEFIMIGEYKGAKDKIKLKHNKCGGIFYKNLYDFKQSRACPKCIINNRFKTNDKFKQEVNDLVGDEYIFLDEYQGSDTKIRVRHNVRGCGRVYLVQPRAFLSGRRCAKCSKKVMRTTEEFKDYFYTNFNTNYEILGEYLGADKPLYVRHKKCGYKFNGWINLLMKDKGCPKCSGKVKISQEEFNEIVYKLEGHKYIFMEEYKGSQTNIKIKHNIEDCGYVYKTSPYNFIKSGARCPKCSGNLKLSQKDFEDRIRDLGKGEYEVLSDYINSGTHVLLEHKCGYRYKVIPTSFSNGRGRCPVCNSGYSITTEIFKKRLENKKGKEYKLIGEYKNEKTEVLIEHQSEDCNYNKFYVKPYSILNVSGCPKCNGGVKHNTDDFKMWIKQNLNDEFEVIGEYVNNNTLIKLRHKVCGKVDKYYPVGIKNGTRCRVCNETSGERKIRMSLESLGVEFRKEYVIRYHNSRLGKVDFVIMDALNTDKILVGIEYDGRQHFEPIEKFGGEDALKETQERDTLKDEWFKENNIPLLRIAYWDYDNIEYILNKKLLELGLIEI